MKILLLSTFLIVSKVVVGQPKTEIEKDFSLDMRLALDRIDGHDMVSTSSVGLSGEKPDEYKAFERLLELATDEELYTLCSHSSPEVRAYAFWGLAKRNRKDLFELIRQHTSDTAKIYFMSGCQVSETSVVRFMIKVVTPKEVDYCEKLSRKQLKYLKSTL